MQGGNLERTNFAFNFRLMSITNLAVTLYSDSPPTDSLENICDIFISVVDNIAVIIV